MDVPVIIGFISVGSAILAQAVTVGFRIGRQEQKISGIVKDMETLAQRVTSMESEWRAGIIRDGNMLTQLNTVVGNLDQSLSGLQTSLRNGISQELIRIQQEVALIKQQCEMTHTRYQKKREEGKGE